MFVGGVVRLDSLAATARLKVWLPLPVPAPVPQWLVQPWVKNYCYSGNTSVGTGTYSKLWMSK